MSLYTRRAFDYYMGHAAPIGPVELPSDRRTSLRTILIILVILVVIFAVYQMAGRRRL